MLIFIKCMRNVDMAFIGILSGLLDKSKGQN